MNLLAGSFVVFAAAFLGGATGFGYGLVATPLLLLARFSLPFVVTINLTIALVTRIVVAYRLRAEVNWARSTLLVLGSIPGLYIGARTLTSVNPTSAKIALGALVMALSLLFARRSGAPAPRPLTGAPLVAGFAGGFLGTVSSLNGVAPVLLLARDKVAPLTFIADLAVYFVVSNAIALGILRATGALSTQALFPAFVLWLPGAVAGNLLGVRLAPRVPERYFRCLTLTVVFVAGALTAATAR